MEGVADPEAISAAVCSFPTLEGAVDTTILTIQSGIPVARIELLDEIQIDAINKYSKLDYPVQPTLFLEFHGTEAGVREDAETVQGIASEFGGEDFKWTTNTEERNKLWQARHDAAYACLALRPGAKAWATDVCVPISRLAECIAETKKDIKGSALICPLVGHVRVSSNASSMGARLVGITVPHSSLANAGRATACRRSAIVAGVS